MSNNELIATSFDDSAIPRSEDIFRSLFPSALLQCLHNLWCADKSDRYSTFELGDDAIDLYQKGVFVLSIQVRPKYEPEGCWFVFSFTFGDMFSTNIAKYTEVIQGFAVDIRENISNQLAPFFEDRTHRDWAFNTCKEMSILLGARTASMWTTIFNILDHGHKVSILECCFSSPINVMAPPEEMPEHATLMKGRALPFMSFYPCDLRLAINEKDIVEAVVLEPCIMPDLPDIEYAVRRSFTTKFNEASIKENRSYDGPNATVDAFIIEVSHKIVQEYNP